MSRDACHLAQAWLPARDYVKAALEARAEVDAGGEIIQLARSCPWKEHLYELEAEMRLPKPIKFCIYEVRQPS
jgi:uncharacterized UPF0160 family protein